MKTSIRSKIMLALFSVAMLAFLSMSWISIKDLHLMRSLAMNYGATISNTSISDSKGALTALAEDRLEEAVAAQAAIAELKLSRIAEQFMSIDPDEFFRKRPAANSSLSQKQIQQFYFPANTNPETLNNELLALYDSLPALNFIQRNVKHLTLVYMMTPNGIFYRFPTGASPVNYDARERIWYKNAVAAKGNIVWGVPYPSAHGNNSLVVTCSRALFKDGKLLCVLGSDITLRTIVADILGAIQDDEALGFLIDRQGNLIAHKGMELDQFEWNQEAVRFLNIVNSKNIGLKKLAAALKKNKTGLLKEDIGGINTCVAYTTIPSTGWTIALALPMEKILAPAEITAGNIQKAVQKEEDSISSSIESLLKKFLLVSLVILILVAVLGFLISAHLIHPIQQLIDGAKVIGSGNLDSKINVSSNDEIQDLAQTLNHMSVQLKEHIERLNAANIARQKIESDLKTAAGIQKALLPSGFSPFTDFPGLEIFADIKPAKQVGGDLFDYMITGENRLFFCIGDVSGKGISASIFMAKAITMLKSLASLDTMSPAEIMLAANRQLERGNDACMFVTAFCGILDLATGTVTVSSAGHNPPFLLSASGDVNLLKYKPTPPLGAIPIESGTYQNDSFLMKTGDSIFLYTDGVTEAMNGMNEQFGMDLLRSVLKKYHPCCHDIANTILAISQSVEEFAQGTEQSDDITMLILKYHQHDEKGS